MSQDAVRALKRCVLFETLSARSLEALATRSVAHRLSRGQVLFLAGERLEGIYLILKGSLRSLRQSRGGREQVLSVDCAGALLGEVPIFDGEPCFATAVADEDAELLFIHQDDLRWLCLESPEVLSRALVLIARRVRYFAELVETLSLHEVDRRVARFLLEESLRCGTPFELGSTHQQIACRVGSVREMVTRAFGHLRKAGLIEVRGRIVNVADHGELARFAHG